MLQDNFRVIYLYTKCIKIIAGELTYSSFILFLRFICPFFLKKSMIKDRHSESFFVSCTTENLII